MTTVMDLLGRSKEPSELKMGVEIERFGWDEQGKIIRYQTHVKHLFQELIEKNGWHPAYQAGNAVLAIERGADHWSLEPGSQLELSAAPVKSLDRLIEQQERLEAEILTTTTAKNWKWEWLGVNPYERASEIEIIPSPRYRIMTEYFHTRGGRGWDMMRLTSGCHVNFDYWCPDHALKLMRTGAFLSPLFVAWFANSPFYQGGFSGRYSERTNIWKSVDPLRSGIPDFIFSENISIGDYVNKVEDIPLMFYFDDEGEAQPAAGKAWKNLPQDLKEKNLLPAIRQIFWDVRLKPCCVELRFLDQNEPAVRLASFALLVGLLQDEENLELLSKSALETNAKKLAAEQDRASLEGLNSEDFYARSKKILEMAAAGLKRRGWNEEKFLQPAEVLLTARKNPAQKLLEGGDFARYQENSLRRRSG